MFCWPQFPKAMPYKAPYVWKQLPLLRVLIPVVLGIVVGFYSSIPIFHLYLAASVLVGCSTLFYVLPRYIKFSFRWVQGLFLQLVFLVAGCIMVYHQDVRNLPSWVGKHYEPGDPLLVRLQEPLVSKPRTYKARCRIVAVKHNSHWQAITGSLLIYIKKDSTLPDLRFGSELVINKQLRPITNSGNPGSFDYRQYCAFQGIFHQVFLDRGEYRITPAGTPEPFRKWLFEVRDAVIAQIRALIPGTREQGVAEALLIGYRDDLDKGLLQAYSNTGVVHIIAISGLHLGLIYAILVWLFRPFLRRRWISWAKPVIIIIVLWTFSLLAGGSPSILRAAIMFTSVVVGQLVNRKASTYNALVVSAVLMLCYNPYTLWDVGFQLSYAAVLSILVFNKSIYNFFYFQNKLLDNVWKLNAVTISAQVLTFPIILFYFQQFPVYCLVTNLVAVPLSGWILFGELALLISVKVFPMIAPVLGKACALMLTFLNGFIEWMDALPFAVWSPLKLNVGQCLLLTLFFASAGYALMRKSRSSRLTAIAAALAFVALRSQDIAFYQNQQKLIIYNIPQHTGIDFIMGKSFWSFTDSSLARDRFLENFHLKPSRVLHRVLPEAELQGMVTLYPFFMFGGKRILLVDQSFHFTSPRKLNVDLIVLAKNARVQIPELMQHFNCRQFVLDGSNSLWKINRWKRDCDSLHLRHHSTPEKGAFVWMF